MGSGTCGTIGLSVISTANECENAASALQLQDTTAWEGQETDRPVGCSYNSNTNWLAWADPSGHPNPNVPCATLDNNNEKFDCICSGMFII